MTSKKEQLRINLTVKSVMFESIQSYADGLGLPVAEAARILLIRGLEQVQLIRTSADSAQALKAMTVVFEQELEYQEAREKQEKKAKTVKAKKDRVPVTPDLRSENRTKQKTNSTVKDIFND